MAVRTAEHNLLNIGSNHSYFTRNRNEVPIINCSLKFFVEII